MSINSSLQLTHSDYYITVMNLILWIGYKNNSCIRETQENSIRILLQTNLPYILLTMVHAYYYAPYPKQPCVEHEVNICYLCCMTLFVLEPSTSFSQVSWSMLWLITSNSNPSCSKNRKLKNENKMKRKIKLKTE